MTKEKKSGTILDNKEIEKKVIYWQKDSEKDFKVAEVLFERKFYDRCLFFCHLTVEKLFKAIVIKETKKSALRIHDLRKLAQDAGLELGQEKKDLLDQFSAFNIIGRYPDDKAEFYKMYSKDKKIAEKYLKLTADLVIWLKKELQKKYKE